jgi:two-component system, OmpR family, phosphate regulon sensor histidine kinase PhoR
MAGAGSIASRVKVAIACGVVLALFAVGFMLRLRSDLAADPASLDRNVIDLTVMLGVGALVLGLAIALVASHLAIEPVRAMTSAARAMRRDLGIRTRMTGEDELGQLGEALDGLAAWVAGEKQGLEDDRNRLIAILESMTEGVLVTSGEGAHDGVIVLANASLRGMFLDAAVPGRALVGRPPVEVLRVAGLDEILDRAAVTPGGASGEVELTGLRPRRLLVRAAPIKADDRAGLVAVFNDVTELRRLELVRRDFVANVSHELRTPIHAISSSAETLEGGALHDEAAAREFLDIIRRQASRLRNIVDDLLELSRIESQEWKLDMTALDLGEVTRVAGDAVAVAAKERGATIERTIPPDVRVHADRRALEHVLINLIDNAVKYGGTPARIEIGAREVDGRVAIAVRDHGPGMEPRHLSRIFERFYRVDAGRSRAAGGTGLGLSIVKNLVEAMNGTVDAESAVGAGTTFTVTLRAGLPGVVRGSE